MPSMIEYLILIVALLRAALRRRADLAAENLQLRQQLAVLTRPTRRRPACARATGCSGSSLGRSDPTGAGTWFWSRPTPSYAGTSGAGGSSGAGAPEVDPGARA